MSEITQPTAVAQASSSLSSPASWSASEVAAWTNTLQLSKDYASSFKERGIDGKILQKMSRSTLEGIGVTNPSDQLIILQSVANGVLTRSSLTADTVSKRTRLPCSSTPVQTDVEPTLERHGFSDHKKRRLFSRSFDGGISEADQVEPSNTVSPSRTSSHLLDILREDNATLKKELETYYQHVRKLQKLEQELERLREAHKHLEATTQRKGKLEETMRHKLEEEIRKLKEANCHHKAEMHTVRRAVSFKSAPPDETMKRELARRDSMITRLVKQNKDANYVREKLEKDLYSTRVALQEKQKKKKASTVRLGSDDSGVDGPQLSPNSTGSNSEDHMSVMYSASIDKLRSVLVAMQTTSSKRADLEQRLRGQLELRVQQLQQSTEEREKNDAAGDGERVSQLEIAVTALKADVVKWEQRCLELAAEKQMALDTAVIPRDTKISHLERLLEESKDSIKELREGKLHYMGLYHEVEKKTSRLESRVSTLEASLREKETLVQTLQILLEPEESENSFSSSSENNPTSDLAHESYFTVPNHSSQTSSDAEFSTGTNLREQNPVIAPLTNGWSTDKGWLGMQQAVTGEVNRQGKPMNGRTQLVEHHQRTNSAKLAREQPSVTYTTHHFTPPPYTSSFSFSNGLVPGRSQTMPRRPISMMQPVYSAPSLSKSQSPPPKQIYPSSTSSSTVKRRSTTNTISYHSPHSSADSLDSLLTPAVPASSYTARNVSHSSEYPPGRSSKSLPISQRRRLPYSGSFADDQSQDSGVLMEGTPYTTTHSHPITCSQHIQL